MMSFQRLTGSRWITGMGGAPPAIAGEHVSVQSRNGMHARFRGLGVEYRSVCVDSVMVEPWDMEYEGGREAQGERGPVRAWVKS
jgi:hypothetical protein